LLLLRLNWRRPTGGTFCAEQAPDPVEVSFPDEEETGAEMTEADEWRQYSAELRQIAVRADDAERQRKLLDLAERWAQFAEELSGADPERH
jgi:hypothetical protein